MTIIDETQKETISEKEVKEFREYIHKRKDHFLIELFKYAGFSADDCRFIFVKIEENIEIGSDEYFKFLEDLLDYVIYKGMRSGLSSTAAINYVDYLLRLYGKIRYEVFPKKKTVQYKGESNKELFKDEYYWVRAIYNKERDVYLIPNEIDELKEYPAKDFIDVVATKVKYKGFSNPENNTEGFEVDKEYLVEEIHDGICYIEGGKNCQVEEVFPLELKPLTKEDLKRLSSKNAFFAISMAIEFGNVIYLAEILDENAVYYSESHDQTIVGKTAILNKFENQRKLIYDKGAMVVVDVLKKINEDDYKLFITYREYANEQDEVLVEINGPYISKITIKDGCKLEEFDEIKEEDNYMKELNEKVERVVYHNDGLISAALIQRVFAVGYSRAARLIDLLEDKDLLDVVRTENKITRTLKSDSLVEAEKEIKVYFANDK